MPACFQNRLKKRAMRASTHAPASGWRSADILEYSHPGHAREKVKKTSLLPFSAVVPACTKGQKPNRRPVHTVMIVCRYFAIRWGCHGLSDVLSCAECMLPVWGRNGYSGEIFAREGLNRRNRNNVDLQFWGLIKQKSKRRCG